MTFCLSMIVEEGLVGLADTRVISGNECITAHKITTYQHEEHALFVMTSGLRSVRDKVVTYFDEVMDEKGPSFERLFKAVNAFSSQIRRVAEEDKEALEEGGFPFNMYALVGGQFKSDKQHKLYLIYPQGNWVEVGHGTPYQIIGAPGYGKPVLDRTLKYDDSMRFAMKVGCLAFDSTRISAADVDFPLDVVLYVRDSFKIVEHRYEANDLLEMTGWWQDRLRQSISELPSERIDSLFDKNRQLSSVRLVRKPDLKAGGNQ
jgi:putative proteasome-type protease